MPKDTVHSGHKSLATKFRNAFSDLNQATKPHAEPGWQYNVPETRSEALGVLGEILSILNDLLADAQDVDPSIMIDDEHSLNHMMVGAVKISMIRFISSPEKWHNDISAMSDSEYQEYMSQMIEHSQMGNWALNGTWQNENLLDAARIIEGRTSKLSSSDMCGRFDVFSRLLVETS